MNKFACMVVFCAFSAVLTLQGALATLHVVGGDTGWKIPPDAATYNNWASSKSFRVGDTLEFNFLDKSHDVLEVAKESYDACDSIKKIGSIIENGPANVNLNSTGDHYYICTLNGHCNRGQKLAISVSADSGTPEANSPTTSPPPPPPPPPPPSSSNVVFASLALAFASVFVGFFF
ncbi:hypothetical protein ACH5RR_008197 [Cinchona calisaya]|uniref:Phytocyanin domain-containing protein n=1 Tax=Cinchona calisaya TaxID=153742 RepID=A0ABD3AAN1_9GENT